MWIKQRCALAKMLTVRMKSLNFLMIAACSLNCLSHILKAMNFLYAKKRLIEAGSLRQSQALNGNCGWNFWHFES